MTSIVLEESDGNVKCRQTSGSRSFETILVRLLSSVLMLVINDFRCSYRGKLNLFDYCVICSINVCGRHVYHFDPLFVVLLSISSQISRNNRKSVLFLKISILFINKFLYRDLDFKKKEENGNFDFLYI